MNVQCGCGWRGDLTEWAATHRCSERRRSTQEELLDAVNAELAGSPAFAVIHPITPIDLLTPAQIMAAQIVRARSALRVI